MVMLLFGGGNPNKNKYGPPIKPGAKVLSVLLNKNEIHEKVKDDVPNKEISYDEIASEYPKEILERKLIGFTEEYLELKKKTEKLESELQELLMKDMGGDKIDKKNVVSLEKLIKVYKETDDLLTRICIFNEHYLKKFKLSQEQKMDVKRNSEYFLSLKEINREKLIKMSENIRQISLENNND